MAHHFFLPVPVFPGETAVLEGENAHHALRVLRLRVGETISLADSRGQGYQAEVVAIHKDRVVAAVKAPLESPEPRVKVTLYQAWPKGDKMDLIVEKCTELGVARIVVINTERSIPRPDREACARRQERWQQKARAAASQSRRHLIPAVEGPLELSEALAGLDQDTLLLVPWEEERSCNLKSVLEASPGVQELAVLIGPEGGLTRAEVDLARKFGGRSVTLGPRILRTETAGLVCLAAIMYALGELS
ncbi:16S rRNA (uracil(1498)-N(3))-methyltransferase [Moorella sulfitireducens (nom. illeg.)]|uniref:16S rRNA (uracil(1498)-N(3))-methyltransferase n=1 Tax=Neomoorella sulfitireducens TaxID=2972948 RepID=UPI0021AC9858